MLDAARAAACRAQRQRAMAPRTRYYARYNVQGARRARHAEQARKEWRDVDVERYACLSPMANAAGSSGGRQARRAACYSRGA